MATMNKSELDLCIMRFMLQFAELQGTEKTVNIKDAATVLRSIAHSNGFDKTDLLTALAPAVEQCRNWLNKDAENFAHNVLLDCLTAGVYR